MALSFSIPRFKREPEVETRASSWTYSGSITNIISGEGRLSFNPESGLDAFYASEVLYRCITMRAAAMSSLNIAVWQGEEKVETDPVADLFNQSSIDADNAVTRKHIMYSRAARYGEAFVYIDRDDNGQPKDFLNIFGGVTPLRDEPKNPDGSLRARSNREKIAPGLAGYRVSTEFGEVDLLPEEVLWLRYPHFTGPWEALAPGAAAHFPAQLIREARDWQWWALKNNARPSGVFDMGEGYSPENAERLKAQLDAATTGSVNANRILVTGGPGGKKFERMSLTPEEMSFLDSIRVSGEGVCVALGVPVDLVFGQSTFDNQDAAWKRLWDDLKPDLRIVETELDRVLWPDPNLTAMFDLQEVSALQENTDALHERARNAWESDGMTWGRYLESLGEEVPDGDPRVQLTITAFRALATAGPPTAVTTPDQPALPSPPKALNPAMAEVMRPKVIEARAKPKSLSMNRLIQRKNWEEDIAEAVGRVADAGKNRAMNNLKKGKRAKADTSQAESLITADVLTAMANKHLAVVIAQAWTGIANVTADAAGIELTAEQRAEIKAVAQAQAQVSIESIVNTTLVQLQGQLEEQEEDGATTEAIVLGVFAALAAHRAKLIATQETTAAMSGGSERVLQFAEFKNATKMWQLGLADHCESCPKMHGQRRKVGERFDATGLTNFANQKPMGPNESHVNCSCYVNYEWDL